MRFGIYTLDLIIGIGLALLRRYRKGAKRPSWSLTTELAVMSMQTSLRHALKWGTGWYRKLQGRSARAFRPDTEIFNQIEKLGTVSAERFETAYTANARQIVLYFHGGGFVSGSTNGHRPFLNILVKKIRLPLVSVEYRLAPEHPFPAALDDAENAYNALIAKGYEPERIVLCGDSAGGGLVVSLLLQLAKSQLRLPQMAILLSPWVHLTEYFLTENQTFDIINQKFLSDCAKKYNPKNSSEALINPLLGDFVGFPPVLVQAGEGEVLKPQLDLLAQKILRAGGQVRYTAYAEMFHAFMVVLPTLPESEAALEEMLDFIRSH